MKTMMKFATAATLAGALAVAVATPSQARISRGGAAAANAANNGYYYGPRYRAAPYANGYGYYTEPGYGAYAYAPRGYEYSSKPMCVIQGSYGHEYDTSFC